MLTNFTMLEGTGGLFGFDATLPFFVILFVVWVYLLTELVYTPIAESIEAELKEILGYQRYIREWFGVLQRGSLSLKLWKVRNMSSGSLGLGDFGWAGETTEDVNFFYQNLFLQSLGSVDSRCSFKLTPDLQTFIDIAIPCLLDDPKQIDLARLQCQSMSSEDSISSSPKTTFFVVLKHPPSSPTEWGREKQFAFLVGFERMSSIFVSNLLDGGLPEQSAFGSTSVKRILEELQRELRELGRSGSRRDVYRSGSRRRSPEPELPDWVKPLLPAGVYVHREGGLSHDESAPAGAHAEVFGAGLVHERLMCTMRDARKEGLDSEAYATARARVLAFRPPIINGWRVDYSSVKFCPRHIMKGGFPKLDKSEPVKNSGEETRPLLAEMIAVVPCTHGKGRLWMPREGTELPGCIPTYLSARNKEFSSLTFLCLGIHPAQGIYHGSPLSTMGLDVEGRLSEFIEDCLSSLEDLEAAFMDALWVVSRRLLTKTLWESEFSKYDWLKYGTSGIVEKRKVKERKLEDLDSVTGCSLIMAFLRAESRALAVGKYRSQKELLMRGLNVDGAVSTLARSEAVEGLWDSRANFLGVRCCPEYSGQARVLKKRIYQLQEEDIYLFSVKRVSQTGRKLREVISVPAGLTTFLRFNWVTGAYQLDESLGHDSFGRICPQQQGLLKKLQSLLPAQYSEINILRVIRGTDKFRIIRIGTPVDFRVGPIGGSVFRATNQFWKTTNKNNGLFGRYTATLRTEATGPSPHQFREWDVLRWSRKLFKTRYINDGTPSTIILDWRTLWPGGLLIELVGAYVDLRKGEALGALEAVGELSPEDKTEYITQCVQTLTPNLVEKLEKGVHYLVDEKNRKVNFTAEGVRVCEQVLAVDLYSIDKSTDKPFILGLEGYIKAKELLELPEQREQATEQVLATIDSPFSFYVASDVSKVANDILGSNSVRRDLFRVDLAGRLHGFWFKRVDLQTRHRRMTQRRFFRELLDHSALFEWVGPQLKNTILGTYSTPPGEFTVGMSSDQRWGPLGTIESGERRRVLRRIVFRNVAQCSFHYRVAQAKAPLKMSLEGKENYSEVYNNFYKPFINATNDNSKVNVNSSYRRENSLVRFIPARERFNRFLDDYTSALTSVFTALNDRRFYWYWHIRCTVEKDYLYWMGRTRFRICKIIITVWAKLKVLLRSLLSFLRSRKKCLFLLPSGRSITMSRLQTYVDSLVRKTLVLDLPWCGQLAGGLQQLDTLNSNPWKCLDGGS